MFQAATPASNQPALSPTRGSGVGGVVDMSIRGAGGAPACADEALEQPVARMAPQPISETAAHRRGAAEAKGAVTCDSVREEEKRSVTNYSLRLPAGPAASIFCIRSISVD